MDYQEKSVQFFNIGKCTVICLVSFQNSKGHEKECAGIYTGNAEKEDAKQYAYTNAARRFGKYLAYKQQLRNSQNYAYENMEDKKDD